MKLRWWLVVLGVVIGVRMWASCDRHRPLRIVTFNIEDFPKHARQVERVFDEIAALDADAIAVQEIVEPARFAREAEVRLGDGWQYVHAPASGPRPIYDLGVLFDRRVFTLVSTAIHDDTRLEGGRHKPTFEVRLQPRAGGDVVRLLVVHLKAGGDGRDIRARQFVALARIVRRVRGSGDRLVLLGDFNATGDADRGDLAGLARATDLAWTTERLACTAFWARDDGCPRSRLDHVLSSVAVGRVEAAGACAREGCGWQDRCPVDAEQVSDHCPVVVDLAR